MTFPDRPRVLLSYAYVRSWAAEGVDWLAGTDLMVDSGGFTAFTLGQTIDRDEYADFLLEHAASIDHAFSLDVIGDWRGSAVNFEHLKARLDGRVSLIPAWHLGSPLAELERLCASEPYVAIGGCVPYAKTPTVIMRHLIQAHRVAAKHGTRLHGLGITAPTTMRLPWWSVDSTSWGSHRYGYILLTDALGKIQRVFFGRPLTGQQRTLVSAYGGDLTRIQTPGFCLTGKSGKEQGTLDRVWCEEAGALAFMTLEDQIGDAQRRPFHIYLASGNSDSTIKVMAAHALGNPFRRASLIGAQ